MKAFEEELLAGVRARHTLFTERVVAENAAEAAALGQPQFPREAIEQFINGFFLFVEEALQGIGGDARAFYLSTAIPAMRDTGISAKLVIGGSAKTVIRMSVELAGAVSAEHRPDAERWLAEFFGDYLGDMAEVWSNHG